MMTLRTALVALALALPGLAIGQPANPIVLQPGQARTIEMPAQSLNEQHVIDTTAADRALAVVASSPAGATLLLRFGSPFVFDRGAPASADYLLEQAHYRSIASDATQRIVVTRASWQPVRAGRWYVMLLNESNAATTVTLTATPSSSEPTSAPITVVFDDPANDCGIAGWTDATPRPPGGGNPGTTLGEQRRLAVAEAVRLVRSELRLTAPIRIQACFSNLGTGNSVVLGQAGPRFVLRNIPSFRVGSQGQSLPPWVDRHPWLDPHTWYPGSTAARLAGTAFCGYAGGSCNAYDLRMTFNDQLDLGNALGGRRFWYGYTPQPSGTDSDFIAVAIHEILHGLGFISYLNLRSTDGNGNPLVVGSKLQGFDDVFSARLVRINEDTGEVRPLRLGTDAERAAAVVSETQLRWDDPAAAASEGNPFSGQFPPANLVPLYAPATIATGSSVSHLGAARTGFGLMLPNGQGPQRTLGLARALLDGIGWSDAERAPPARRRPRHWQLVDTARPGASVNFGYLGTLPDGTDLHYAILFSYGADGLPEWYLTAGPVIDGVFMPANNANGDSLPRFRIDFAAGRANPDPNVRGQIRIDFNQPDRHPACMGRSQPKAVMAWTIGSDRNIAWCLTDLLPGLESGALDLTGLWGTVGNLPDGRPDFGWGLDVISFRAGARDGLFAVLYYADADGTGRWAFAVTDNYVPGTEYPLFDRTSACRTCPVPPTEPTTQIGTIRLDLREALQGQASVERGNRIRFRVTYPRAPGGTFERDVAVGLQSSPVRPAP
jgi:hypothetical protein